MVRKLMMAGVMIMVLSATTHVFAEDVFITPKGKKYHKEICRLVKNKDGVTKMDKKEAVMESYGPCGRCFKEDVVSKDQSKNEDQVKKIEKKENKG